VLRRLHRSVSRLNLCGRLMPEVATPPPIALHQQGLHVPLQRDLVIRVLNRRGKQTVSPPVATGKTVDISSHTILFTTETDIVPATRLEISVDWPVTLNTRCGLKFVALCTVAWVAERCVLAAIERYQFRTCRLPEPVPV
jgi:hypothetical protein